MRLALLALLGGSAEQAVALDDAAWGQLARMSAEHRLESLLHGMARRGEFAVGAAPASLLSEWETAARDQAVGYLVQRRALLQAAHQLQAAGLPHVALKGAWLAPYVYTYPAERPLRDLDFLLPTAALVPAWHRLRAAGWSGAELGDARLEEFARHERHLPPLFSAEGVMLELHGALHDLADPRVDAEPLAAQMLAEPWREDGDPVPYPPPAAALAHLCLHAAYSHALNTGPLLLSDIDQLLRRHQIVWSAFWRAAEAGGYARGAALCLALTERWRRPGLREEAGCPIALADEEVEEASHLLLQPAAARKEIALQAALRRRWRAGGPAEAMAALVRRSRTDRRDAAGSARGSRLWRTAQAAAAFLVADTRHAARRTARLHQLLAR